jgi:hypothetical protein
MAKLAGSEEWYRRDQDTESIIDQEVTGRI